MRPGKGDQTVFSNTAWPHDRYELTRHAYLLIRLGKQAPRRRDFTILGGAVVKRRQAMQEIRIGKA